LSLSQSFQFGELKSRERNSDTRDRERERERERKAGFNSYDEAVKWKTDFSLLLAGRVFLGVVNLWVLSLEGKSIKWL